MDYSNSTQQKYWNPPEEYYHHDGKANTFLLLLIEFAKLDEFKLPQRCLLTSLSYLKRYFCSMETLPDDSTCYLAILTSIYVAGKIEELPPPPGYDADQRGVHVDKMAELAILKFQSDFANKRNNQPGVFLWSGKDAGVLAKEIIAYEMKFLETIKFHLFVHHPYRVAIALLFPSTKLYYHHDEEGRSNNALLNKAFNYSCYCYTYCASIAYRVVDFNEQFNDDEKLSEKERILRDSTSEMLEEEKKSKASKLILEVALKYFNF